MQIEEILNHFKRAAGYFPTEALNAALAQQEAITPYLLAILENVVSDPNSVSIDQMDYLFSLYLLSKFREKQAFPLIITLASLPGDLPDELLGDFITEALSRFVVSTFNGDLVSIKALIENPELNDWSRYASLRSLLGLVALDRLKREELVEYLRLLFHSSLINNVDFATNVVHVAVNIYPEELIDEINNAFDSNKVNSDHLNKTWITEILEKGKEHCLEKYVYKTLFHLPIDNVEEAMGWMSAFQTPIAESDTGLSPYDYFMPEIAVTYVRTTPKIGRNEPCPCGSGKKFKKCCLQTLE